MNENWQPSGSLPQLKIRAKMLASIRRFFANRHILEVETPLIYPSTASDPPIASFSLPYQNKLYYLQTSPEFAMKRLLSAGSGPIYQICKAFRMDEAGQRHNPEFTLLEWYRPGFNHYQLMDEVDALLQIVLTTKKAQRLSYRELFRVYLQIDPFDSTEAELAVFAKKNKIIIAGALTKDDWLNLLLTHLIEPQCGFDAPLFIYDYPASQAALAKIHNDNPPVAERFEVYINGVELANGYHELADANEQRQRFNEDNRVRKQQGLPAIPLDEKLLRALSAGFPNCAGVALGLDRLAMIATQSKHIAEVMAFAWDSC